MKHRIKLHAPLHPQHGFWLARKDDPRDGYHFSPTRAWEFPSEAQARAKVRVLDRHFQGCVMRFEVVAMEAVGV